MGWRGGCGREGVTHGEHVAAYYGCFVGGREEGSLGDPDVDRLQAALVQWDVFGDETAQAVYDGGVRDGFRGVDVALRQVRPYLIRRG